MSLILYLVLELHKEVELVTEPSSCCAAVHEPSLQQPEVNGIGQESKFTRLCTVCQFIRLLILLLFIHDAKIVPSDNGYYL